MGDLDDIARAARKGGSTSYGGPSVVYIQVPSQPRRRSGCLPIIVLAVAAFGGVAIWSNYNFSSKDIPPAVAGPAEQARIRTELQKLVESGAIYSIDAGHHQVRVEPQLWAAMDVDQKKGLVFYFSSKFRLLGDGSDVQIKSSLNDDVLGEKSDWSGVQIHR